ncbi:CDGSH iron-sulfur domain-containing protein [Bifidobacterium cuniculi]|uniref:Zinc finger CDGSH type family protein n=1 Tax=Bifidobacterium cuniculi TaxID=1688 RepID=A0A087AX74_9BIFI|nr:CDGSH iron-sulfur domain-containing protein [Bifidobacterium cuniculi]KFI63374.1 zinc finger CDGSH type family protein [Bifidobacterium cuniculi]
MGEWRHTHPATTERRGSVSAHGASTTGNGQAGHGGDDMPSVTITKNGPYIVRGKVRIVEDTIVAADDRLHMQYNRIREFTTQPGKSVALCRCGDSKNPPFCDGSHETCGFDGTETASRKPYDERAELFEGPVVSMGDDQRCAYARMCHQIGSEAWTLTEEAKTPDKVSAAIVGAWNCPTGRLVSFRDSDGTPIEQRFDPIIVLLEDVEEGVSAPIFVAGDIKLISADGTEYERRNRYALCRCGSTQEMPFCDAMHINVQYRDNSPAWQGETGTLDPTFRYEARP